MPHYRRIRSTTECNRAHAAFPSSTIVDRRISPSHGYRAVHVVVRREGRIVEIQVRTVLQHQWAEVTEKLSDEIDPGLKYGTGDQEFLAQLFQLSAMVRSIEDRELQHEENARNLSEADDATKRHEHNDGTREIYRRLQESHLRNSEFVVQSKNKLLSLFDQLRDLISKQGKTK